MKVIHNEDNKQIENWKDISKWKGFYQVSDLGRVKSLDRVIEGKSRWVGKRLMKFLGRILKEAHYSNGYSFVVLSSPAKTKQEMIHRLVAKAFIPNPHDKKEVNHLNGIKRDNNVKNLEWVTPSENQYHSFANGFNKQKRGYTNGTHQNCKRVINIQTKEIFTDVRKVAEKTGLSYSYIASMLNGNTINKTFYKYLQQ